MLNNQYSVSDHEVPWGQQLYRNTHKWISLFKEDFTYYYLYDYVFCQYHVYTILPEARRGHRTFETGVREVRSYHVDARTNL